MPGMWPNPTQMEYLSLTALPRACLNHELGHWVQTLVSPSYRYYSIHVANFHIKRVGYFSKACRPRLPHSELPVIKNTPKSLSTAWTNDSEGEAGDYVEICSQGGGLSVIPQYERKVSLTILHILSKIWRCLTLCTAYIMTGPVKMCDLTLSYLRQYESSTDFPKTTESMLRMVKSKTRRNNNLFPSGTDNCKLSHQSGCLRLRPGPGQPLAAAWKD